MNRQKGFTLIELLVVVLIIGILAAIALPQYRKAVEKSRIAEANIILRSIENSLERYFMENPDVGQSPLWDKLDIELNLPIADDDNYAKQGKYFWYSLESSIQEIFACNGNIDDNSDYCLFYTYEVAKPSSSNRSCRGDTNFGKKVCQSLCGADTCYY